MINFNVMLSSKENIFYIIDGYGFIFRSFYALPKLTTKSGEPIGAVYGFFKMLISLINSSRPSHMVIALDTGHRTFRNDLYDEFVETKDIKILYQQYKMNFLLSGLREEDIFNLTNEQILELLCINKHKCLLKCMELGIINDNDCLSNKKIENFIEKIPKLFILMYFLHLTDKIKIEDYKTQYKANRHKCPDELRSQFKIVKEFIDTINIKSESVHGFEADDVIASLTAEAIKINMPVVVVSADKDLCQLVQNNKVGIFDPAKKQYLNEQGVIDKFGVEPKQIVDYLSIIGDKSDNVIGVDGIGPKGAIKLLKEYKSVSRILENINKLDDKTRQKFINSKDWLMLAQKLIKLRFDACKIDNIEDFKLNIDHKSLSMFMDKYDFREIEKYKSKSKNTITQNDINQKKSLF